LFPLGILLAVLAALLAYGGVSHADGTQGTVVSGVNGFDLNSYALPYSPLWYRGPNAIGDAIRYAKFYSRSHPLVIQVYDEAGNVIETQQHFRRP
jgi:hypothetical protein